MCSTGLFKRVIPFLVTLAIGLFVASFFVDLTPRSFSPRQSRQKRWEEYRQMYIQEHQRRIDAERELDRLRQNPTTLMHSEPWVRPNDYVPPVESRRADR